MKELLPHSSDVVTDLYGDFPRQLSCSTSAESNKKPNELCRHKVSRGKQFRNI